MSNDIETAVVGGGCFWCVEAVFRRIDGILSAEAGYAGGEWDKPSYEEVCSGQTGHAEVIKLDFNTQKISYEEILDIFFASHDPTTLNRQGADTGTQYRSIILYLNEDQKSIARQKLEDLNTSGKYKNRAVTEIKALEKFWPAEEYHQKYFEKNPYAPYCRFVIEPKIAKLKP